MQNKQLRFYDLGLIDYSQAWEFQKNIFEEILNIKTFNRESQNQPSAPTFNALIFCEHPNVFTLGKSGKSSHLLASNEELMKTNTSFVETNRGGDITYHGPGQLVVYPIIDLDNFFTDIHKYMRFLEEVVIKVCADFGINAGRINSLTGVWLEPESDKPRKICAMGVKTSRWVTMHGLALNVSVNLDFFNLIIPCGISDKSVTSMLQETDNAIDIAWVKESMLKHFASVFDCTIING